MVLYNQPNMLVNVVLVGTTLVVIRLEVGYTYLPTARMSYTYYPQHAPPPFVSGKKATGSMLFGFLLPAMKHFGQ